MAKGGRKRSGGGEPNYIDFGEESGLILRDPNTQRVYAITDAALAEFEVTVKVEQSQIDSIFKSSNTKWDAVHLGLIYRANSA